ncbi:MAG: outer membrane beta-barrel protein [Flavobacteriales bacterium]|nr:outer membrane beta-barrel protein [Flavobacteriales bacterium]
MKRSLLALLVVVLSTQVKAQYAWDIGVHLGGANYLGEMGGKEQTRRDFIWDMKLGQTRWSIGVFGRRKLNRSFSVSAGLMYLRLQGADALSTNPQRVGRNLNFRNDMFELYVRPEFTIFQDNDIGGKGRYRTDFRLFLYAGAALFYHNPKAQINREGAFYALQPLQTEGVAYSKFGFAIPAGLGMHITKKRRHRYGFDFGWRTTFTDYLDDASTVYIDHSGSDPTTSALADQHQHFYPTVAAYLSTTDYQDGVLVTTAGGDLVQTPDKYQYGYWDPDGPSKPSENKRGDPTHNDCYLTMTLTYSYVLKGQSNFYRQRYSWIRGKKRIGRKSRAKF